MFDVTYKLTDFFFDKKAIVDKLSSGERRAMVKIGSHIRRAARSAIRKRKRSSLPGSPPSSHTSSKVATLRNILFGYEPSKHTVVVGPVLLSRLSRRRAFYLPKPGVRGRDAQGRFTLKSDGGVWIANFEPSRTSPALMEFGGTARATLDGTSSVLRYAARPFMGPALEQERKSGKLIDAWRNLL